MLTTIKSGPRFSGIKVLHDPGSNSVEFNILPQDTLRGIEYNGQTSNSKRADHFSELYAGKCEIDKEKATKYLSELIAPAEYEKRVRGFRELDDSLGLKSTENNSKYYEKNLNGIGLNPNAYYKFFKAIINESTIPNKTKKEMGMNRKRFFVSLIVLIPLVLFIDMAYDSIFKTLIWKEIFATDNVFFKILTAIVGAYFYATLGKQEKK